MESSAPIKQQTHRLYVEHAGWLRHWLRSRLGCPERAADCTQETFLRLLSRREAGRLEEPRAFLARIATRLLIDDVRRRRLEQAWREACVAAEPEAAVAPSPQSLHEIIETLEHVARLLDGLPEKPRLAFLRFRLDGASQAEIAGELGVSVSMVKKYVAQGLLHCHWALQQAEGR